MNLLLHLLVSGLVPVVAECHSNSDHSTLYDIAVGFRWNTLQVIVLGIALLEPHSI